MTYRANLNVKINTDAVKQIKKMAKANTKRDFTDVMVEVTKKFNLTVEEANKAMCKAELELMMELMN